MSDNNQSNPPAIKPIKKTSAVPLRKETVRVTLKAPGVNQDGMPAGVSDGTGAQDVIPAPTLDLGSTSQIIPPAATVETGIMANAPSAPQAAPLKHETMRVTLKADTSRVNDSTNAAPAAPDIGTTAPTAPSIPSYPDTPAATIPLGAAATKLASPAPTMILGSAAPTVPLATQPLGTLGQSLPKATVQLQQTQPLTQGLGTPTQAATIQTVFADDDTRGKSGAALPLSIIAFALSLIVLYFQFTHAKVWVDEHEDEKLSAIFDPVED